MRWTGLGTAVWLQGTVAPLAYTILYVTDVFRYDGDQGGMLFIEPGLLYSARNENLKILRGAAAIMGMIFTVYMGRAGTCNLSAVESSSQGDKLLIVLRGQHLAGGSPVRKLNHTGRN